MPNIKLPVTRYYGSKRKLIKKIWDTIDSLDLNFNSILDAFGGTGMFSYYAKVKGKSLIYNDIFKFNSIIANALIGNKKNELTYDEAIKLLLPVKGRKYKNTISKYFKDIYFTDEENEQIDIYFQNIKDLKDENKILSAYYILFQSCIIKRPYNLFHRNNLNMRLNYSGGSFGNKKTWERTFPELFDRFIIELNTFTFDNGQNIVISNSSALNCNYNADLIYIDPPYFSNKGHHTTYHSKYHFLEGLANYELINEDYIDFDKKNREILINKNVEFEKANHFLQDLNNLLLRHINSHIVISYRNNGIPQIENIAEVVANHKGFENVRVFDLGNYGYALNKNNNVNNEFLIVGINV
ncbi:DNA adenine methylase [Myroides phaeus]|uniref:DNA adenine methylase n=1 Tax=Myroides phaeus TaxID=702745 RepID=UPI002DBB0E06|nr:DNA adenine methylase [Myroides phaeus]MEC4117147.1 DNA adenine methylase [Myroides phaeus]